VPAIVAASKFRHDEIAEFVMTNFFLRDNCPNTAISYKVSANMGNCLGFVRNGNMNH